VSYMLYDPDSVKLPCVASDDYFGQREEDPSEPGNHEHPVSVLNPAADHT
jgi:hypothetical protein